MAPPQVTSNNKKRRRKKRRTEDFSDSSDSSSSSSSSPSSDEETSTIQPKDDINIDDIIIDSEDESVPKGIGAPEPLSDKVHQNLTQSELTTTQLSNINNFSTTKITNVAEIQETLVKDKSKLNAQFLTLMAGEFSDDLDELRKKPDFNDKSLVLLAKALQSGSNMFDPDTLNVIATK